MFLESQNHHQYVVVRIMNFLQIFNYFMLLYLFDYHVVWNIRSCSSANQKRNIGYSSQTSFGPSHFFVIPVMIGLRMYTYLFVGKQWLVLPGGGGYLNGIGA